MNAPGGKGVGKAAGKGQYKLYHPLFREYLLRKKNRFVTFVTFVTPCLGRAFVF